MMITLMRAGDNVLWVCGFTCGCACWCDCCCVGLIDVLCGSVGVWFDVYVLLFYCCG